MITSNDELLRKEALEHRVMMNCQTKLQRRQFSSFSIQNQHYIVRNATKRVKFSKNAVTIVLYFHSMNNGKGFKPSKRANTVKYQSVQVINKGWKSTTIKYDSF